MMAPIAAISRVAVALALLCLVSAPAVADAVADFYAGRRITLIVATPPGGPYDICARLLARHLGRHIPGNPTIIVQNMAGATGMLAADYVYSKAPQDGTILGNLHNMLPLMKTLGRLTADLDPAKFNWVGNMTRETGDAIVSAKAPAKTIEDAKHVEVIMGAASPMALAAIYPRVMNAVLGTKFRVVTGYNGFAGVEHAIEEGEVQGNAGDTWYSGVGRMYQLYQEGAIRVIVQIGTRSPELADVPLLTDLAGNDADRTLLELFSSPYEVGKPTAMGPGVPPERFAAVRAAYEATLADPALLADAKKLGVTVAPVSGPELAALVTRLVNLPPELVARARAAVAQ